MIMEASSLVHSVTILSHAVLFLRINREILFHFYTQFSLIRVYKEMKDFVCVHKNYKNYFFNNEQFVHIIEFRWNLHSSSTWGNKGFIYTNYCAATYMFIYYLMNELCMYLQN